MPVSAGAGPSITPARTYTTSPTAASPRARIWVPLISPVMTPSVVTLSTSPTSVGGPAISRTRRLYGFQFVGFHHHGLRSGGEGIADTDRPAQAPVGLALFVVLLKKPAAASIPLGLSSSVRIRMGIAYNICIIIYGNT